MRSEPTPCDTCFGAGEIESTYGRDVSFIRQCSECEGRGTVWLAPVEDEDSEEPASVEELAAFYASGPYAEMARAMRKAAARDMRWAEAAE